MITNWLQKLFFLNQLQLFCMLSMLDQYRKESWVSSAFSCSNRQGSGRGRDDGTENCPFPMVTPAISSNLAVKSYLGSVSVWVTSMLPGQCHILMFDPMIERFGSKIPRAEKCLAHNAIYIYMCQRNTTIRYTTPADNNYTRQMTLK